MTDPKLIAEGKRLSEEKYNARSRTERNGHETRNAEELQPAMPSAEIPDDPGPEPPADDNPGQSTGNAARVDGAEVLDKIVLWFSRFIAVTDPDDLYILALWTAHTYLVRELYTTPRLQIDSVIFGSGKTTVLDHLKRLCLKPVQAATLSSPALLPRMLETSMRTVLLDEVDRSLRPDRPGVEDLIGVVNSGYRLGASRPVLVPAKGGGWDAQEMPTFAPVAMAGNSPNLPPDTVSRSIRILLMPDLDGTVEDSDWELIAGEVNKLRSEIAEWTDSIREQVKGMAVDLPQKCIGRSKEKWRPLMRIATAAGGGWPRTTNRLIVKMTRLSESAQS